MGKTGAAGKRGSQYRHLTRRSRLRSYEVWSRIGHEQGEASLVRQEVHLVQEARGIEAEMGKVRTCMLKRYKVGYRVGYESHS